MDMANNNSNEPSSKAGDYLWDGSGQPDPEIQKLEAVLGRFRYNRPTPLPVVRDRWAFLPRFRLFPALIAGAAAAVLLVAFATFVIRERKPGPAAVGWDVSAVTGTPHIGEETLRAKGKNRLAVGQILETDAQSRASLESPEIGQVEIEPSTRLRLLTMSEGQKWIALDRGTIHAHIWAPPGEFVVDTPSAVTVDLGCSYTLQVDNSGSGIVRTSLGWVGFKRNGRESFIPAGAACSTRPQVGPGTPYFEDASPEFRAALQRFDFDDQTPQQRAEDLTTVLEHARRQDALTLWHLLSRVDEDQRAQVYQRLNSLAPAPPSVTKDGILRLDQPMLDLWWNGLGFDDISIWRQWERSWSGSATQVSPK